MGVELVKLCPVLFHHLSHLGVYSFQIVCVCMHASVCVFKFDFFFFKFQGR